jgi:hypothetical protein
VLRRNFDVPAKAVTEIESFLRSYHVQPEPRELPGLKLGDRNDLLVDRLGTQGASRNPGYRGTRKCSTSTKNPKVYEL